MSSSKKKFGRVHFLEQPSKKEKYAIYKLVALTYVLRSAFAYSRTSCLEVDLASIY